MSSGKAKINVAVAISDVAEFYEKENINDFSAWLAASAAQDAYYKIHPNGGFLMKQDMGAMQLLYLFTSVDQEFIASKMQTLREAPLDVYHSGRVFRTFLFIIDFADTPAGIFTEFLKKELDANIRAKLLTEFIVYDFRAGSYLRIGGGRVQDRLLRNILDHASEAVRMSPEERRNFTEEKKNAYRETLRDIRPQRNKKTIFHPLLVLLVINISVYMLDLIFEAKLGYQPIEYFGIQYNGAVLEGEWWRLITSIFLHADFSHLLGNMLMLVYLSSILNNFYSDLEYWIVYLTSGLAGSLLTLLLMDSSARSLGASGAIMGLGGVLIYRMFFGKSARAFRYAGSYFIIAFMVVYNLIYGLFVENVNNYAHFSGFITGFLLAMLFEKIKVRRDNATSNK